MFFFLHDANDHLRIWLFYLSMATLFSAFVLLFVALITYKKSLHAAGAEKKYQRCVELLWAMIPLLMLCVMLIPIVNMVLHSA